MPNPTFDDVLADAKAQIRGLQDSERKLSDEIESIRARDPQAPLSDQDKAQLTNLRDARDAVLDAIEKVALVTLENLDNTDEVKSLAENIRAVRQNLQGTLNKVKAIGNLAQTVSDLLDRAGQLEIKVKGIADKLKT